MSFFLTKKRLVFMNCQGLLGFRLVKCIITKVSSIAWRTFFSNVKHKVKQLFKINIKTLAVTLTISNVKDLTKRDCMTCKKSLSLQRCVAGL